MKKLVFALMVAALPATSFAAGIDISWVDCIGGSGAPATNQNFNCAATTTYNLHFQFKLPAPIPNFVAFGAYVDYQAQNPGPVEPFWQYEDGGCQMAPTTDGLAIFDDVSTAPSPSGRCQELLDPWGSDGTGGSEDISAYINNFRRPGNGYLVMADTRPDPVPLTAGANDNYWIFRLNFRTANRAACAGCASPGIILWQRASLESNDGSPAVLLDNADKMGNCVTINGASAGLCPVVPTRSTTWGQVKSLYR
jgi:hypothetical protein